MNTEILNADYEFDYGGTPENQAMIVNDSNLFETIEETVNSLLEDSNLKGDESREFNRTLTDSMVTSEPRSDGQKLSDAYEVSYTVIVEGCLRGDGDGYELEMPIEVSIEAKDRDGNPF